MSENILEDLIMILSCRESIHLLHNRFLVLYCSKYTWVHRLTYKIHFSLSSSHQEEKSEIRWDLYLVVLTLWQGSGWWDCIFREVSWSGSTEPVEWLYVYHVPRKHSNFPLVIISISPWFLRELSKTWPSFQIGPNSQIPGQIENTSKGKDTIVTDDQFLEHVSKFPWRETKGVIGQWWRCSLTLVVTHILLSKNDLPVIFLYSMTHEYTRMVSPDPTLLLSNIWWKKWKWGSVWEDPLSSTPFVTRAVSNLSQGILDSWQFWRKEDVCRISSSVGYFH